MKISIKSAFFRCKNFNAFERERIFVAIKKKEEEGTGNAQN